LFNNFLYLLSNHYNYAKMICDDAGPGYAVSRNWNTAQINSNLPSDKILVVDNRISSSDFTILDEIINLNNHTILFRIGDGMKETIDNENIQYLLSIKPNKNIFFYSTYSEDFIQTILKQKHGFNKVFSLPYPYDAKNEKEINLGTRKHKIIVSGSLAAASYPLRWYFHSNTYHKIWALRKVKYLKHPGYPDIGQMLQHPTIRTDYINYLTQFKFMLVTPSKFDYELLKFRECAYAGCCLVGDLASSINISKELLPGLISLDKPIKDQVNLLMKLNDYDILKSINDYRRWFHINRDVKTINADLLERISASRNIQ